MHLLLQSLDLASASAAGALLSAIWQGTLLALLVALCLRLLPGATAALRSFIWTAVFLVVMALHLRPLLPGGSAAVTVASGTHSVQVDGRWALALVSVWVLLASARLVALARSGMRLHQIARRSTPVVANPALRTLLVHGRRHVELCVSDEVDRPCILGFNSPRILLPPDLLATLQTPELAHIVLHEMEHLRRGDPWLNLLQKLALALSPLNPVLLWVERRLCLERELACDDGVLRSTGARKLYATCLTNLAEHAMVRRSLSLALGLWERRSELTRRVQRILLLPELSMGRTRAMAVGVTLIAAITGGAAFLASGPQLVTFSVPSVTQASVAGLVTPAPAGNLAVSPELPRAHTAGAAPAYVQTAFRLDRSPRPSHGSAAKRRASTLTLKARVRPNLSRARPVVTLTSYRTSRRAPAFVLTDLATPDISYAAVPWFNGWLIVQL